MPTPRTSKWNNSQHEKTQMRALTFWHPIVHQKNAVELTKCDSPTLQSVCQLGHCLKCMCGCLVWWHALQCWQGWKATKGVLKPVAESETLTETLSETFSACFSLILKLSNVSVLFWNFPKFQILVWNFFGDPFRACRSSNGRLYLKTYKEE